MEISEKFLPIGTVVLLKGGTKKAMITGFCSVALEDNTKIYDYTGCVYPEGYLDFEQICLFDHEQIQEVYHMGYQNEEDEKFKMELNKILNELETEQIYENDNPIIIPKIEEDSANDITKTLEYL